MPGGTSACGAPMTNICLKPRRLRFARWIYDLYLALSVVGTSRNFRQEPPPRRICFLRRLGPSCTSVLSLISGSISMKKPSPHAQPSAKPTLSGILERCPADLRPWPSNPRTHSDKQLAKLKASIRKFGFTAPVLVDEEGVILSGHGRVQAAKELGLQTIPTRVISGLNPAEKRAYVIADNKLALLSELGPGLLKAEIGTPDRRRLRDRDHRLQHRRDRPHVRRPAADRPGRPAGRGHPRRDRHPRRRPVAARHSPPALRRRTRSRSPTTP